MPNDNIEQAHSERELDYHLRFVLRDETGSLRERLHRGLVERALKTGNRDHVMTSLALRQRIAELCGVREYPDELVLQGLEALVNRGDVHRVGVSGQGDTLYGLSESRFAFLDEAFRAADEHRAAFVDSVVTRVTGRVGELPPEDALLVVSAVDRLTGRVLSALGEHCAQKLVREKRFGPLDEYPSVRGALGSAIATLPAPLQQPVGEVLIEILREPNPAQAVYLYSAGQLYYITSILHLDPELLALERIRFEGTTVYLDTNIIVSLLLKKHRDHDVVASLVSMSARLGLNLRYAARTEAELWELLEGANHQYAEAPPLSEATAAKFARAVDNPFLEEWLASYFEHRASWRQFRVRLDAWREILENEFGITCDSAFPVVSEGALYERLNAALAGTRRELAADHDAQLLAGVDALAASDSEEEHPFGGRYWFDAR